ncbi:hypothetical protein [Nonlabens xiamenensis]|uniref:hypothetical protein n=1 Tax=Nonlabens xiamenensis TaxID=2341043 RepID=UPI0013DE0081|nr:hypothetical protein [Nonlabens xiamenensis]|tara:strand:- start:273 stop:446 length:174 start_codon:yes stop_codon:yes gene_type:complete
MDYTANEISLLDLIKDIHNTFYYVGEENDNIDDIDLKTLDEIVARFKRQVYCNQLPE